MQSSIKLFVSPTARAPAGHLDPPRELHVEAPSKDQLRAAAHAQVAAQGYRVRTVSFGAQGLVVYAEEQP